MVCLGSSTSEAEGRGALSQQTLVKCLALRALAPACALQSGGRRLLTCVVWKLQCPLKESLERPPAMRDRRALLTLAASTGGLYELLGRVTSGKTPRSRPTRSPEVMLPLRCLEALHT